MSEGIPKKHLIKTIAGWLCLFALLLGLRQLPFREWLLPRLDHLAGMGISGQVIFVLIGMCLTVLFVPVSVVVFSSGMLFGLGTGFALASVILLAGTLLGYLGGQTLWPRIKEWPMFQNRIFKAIRKAIEQEGLLLVTFLRLTPFLHFMTGNIFFGSLNLKWAPYLFFSYLGMIPGTLIVVYAGSVASQTLEEGQDISLWQMGFFAIGVLVFSWVSWRITVATRKRLQSVDESADTSTTTAR